MQLTDIQKLQFSDKGRAEADLLGFLKEHEDPEISKVELTPRPQSLNSINGFISYENGQRYFFKTHTEENEQISEYYNAASLAKAGYPIYSARQISHRPGKQIALYEIINLPTMFDLWKEAEDELISTGKRPPIVDTLVAAQTKFDQTVAGLYQKTITTMTPEADIKAPVHQLFSHRLAEDGRVGLFYRGQSIKLDSGELAFDDLAQKTWVINGVEYSDTLNSLIDRARQLLEPQGGPGVIGHGDAHNGNLFVDLRKREITLFDPAFAGTHNTFIDMTKPSGHNIFNRWMYYPEMAEKEFQLSYEISPNRIEIKHDFFPSSLRLEFLDLRNKFLLTPTLQFLKAKQFLPANWQDFFRASHFCCPFLTVNLFAAPKSNGSLAERYALKTKLLGFAMAVEFGALHRKGSSKLSEAIATVFSAET